MTTHMVALLHYLRFSYINFKHNNTNWGFVARYGRDLIPYSSAVNMMYPALGI